MKNKPHQLLDKNYELGDNKLLRQLNHLRRMHFSTMGWFHSGPGLKNIVILFILHRLGRPIFYLHAWYQHQTRIKSLLRRVLPGD